MERISRGMPADDACRAGVDGAIKRSNMHSCSIRGVVSLLSLGLFTAGCSDESVNGANSEGGAEPNFTAFDAAVQKFVADHGLRGASAAIVEKDRGIVHTAGYGEFAVDRTYLIMSSSKILSVGVLMRLVDQGLLDIDAPIGTYVSGWGTGKPELTVAELVSNSSGLTGIVDNLLYAPYACQGDATAALTDCAKAIYIAADSADRIPPDTEFHYGGGQWQLAGGIAEAVSGKSWAQLMQETYGPCQVPSLGYTNAASMISLTLAPDGGLEFGSIGYPKTVDGDPSVLPSTQNPSIEGGVYTTVQDYAKLLSMHINGGMCGGNRVLSEQAITRMRQDRIATYGGNTEQQMRLILTGADDAALQRALQLSGYGMGWWVDRAHPGIFVDPGAFGANAWIDVPRGYGAFVAIEGNVVLGADLALALEPVADAAFDAWKR